MCTSRAWRNTIAASYPETPVRWRVDLRRLSRGRRRQRDHPRPRRRRGPALPRPPRRSRRHLHHARLDAARALDLRHGDGAADLRLRADARRPARRRLARQPAGLRLRLLRGQSRVLRHPLRRPRDLRRVRRHVGAPARQRVQGARRPGARRAAGPHGVPPARRRLAGGRLAAPLRRDLVLPRRLRDRAVGQERPARPGDAEPRHARSDLAGRDRDRAGLHRLRLLGHRDRPGDAARVQRRDEADADRDQHHPRLHRALPHARAHRLALDRRQAHRGRIPRTGPAVLCSCA